MVYVCLYLSIGLCIYVSIYLSMERVLRLNLYSIIVFFDFFCFFVLKTRPFDFRCFFICVIIFVIQQVGVCVFCLMFITQTYSDFVNPVSSWYIPAMLNFS